MYVFSFRGLWLFEVCEKLWFGKVFTHNEVFRPSLTTVGHFTLYSTDNLNVIIVGKAIFVVYLNVLFEQNSKSGIRLSCCSAGIISTGLGLEECNEKIT